MKNKRWYDVIKNSADTTDVTLHGEIGEGWFEEPTDAKNFIKDLKKIKTKNIILHINSPGGSVFDGVAIYNALVEHDSYISVFIDAVAASIASVIAMAGDKIVMPKNAMMMIHNPSSCVCGNATQMRKAAGVLDKLKTSILSTYVDRTGQSEGKIIELMDTETWFTAQEAIDAGFADEIADKTEKKATITNMVKMGYRNIPKQFNNIIIEKKEKQGGEENMDKKEFKAKDPELYKEIFALGVTDGKESSQSEIAATATNLEMERIKSVEAQCLVGHEDLISGLKFDGKTTGEQAAVIVLKAEREICIAAQAALKSDSVKNVQKSLDPDNVDNVLPEGKEKWTKEFKNSADLQAEFKKLDTFLAYQAGTTAGRVKKYEGRK